MYRLAVTTVLLLSIVAQPAAAFAETALDWDLPRGHFYTQAGGDSPRPDDGFLVADRPGYGFPTGRNFVRFWSEFNRYGNVGIVGYPASRPFIWDGFDVQVFQKGIFQWRPEQGNNGQAWFMNVFDEFTRRGLDARLRREKQVPLPGEYDDRGKSFEQIRAERMALLAGHPAFVRQYASVPDPLALYGLPNSSVEDFGAFYAVRLQRAAFQEWRIDAPGIARVGEVTVVNAGDLAKEYGLIPEIARQPEPPPVRSSEQIAVFTPGLDEQMMSPFRVAGDARAFEAVVRWELVDAAGNVLGRGATNARACCEWSSFEFEVPYAIPAALTANLAVWGASGRDEADRPGQVRLALQLSNVERPAAAKDGSWLIEPLSLVADNGTGTWLVRVRVRNESGVASTLAAAGFGLRDEKSASLTWSDAASTWSIGPGEAHEVDLRLSAPPGATPASLRLLHRVAGSTGSATPVVIDLPDGDRDTRGTPAT